MGNLSHKEAVEQAVKLRKQGVPYSDITEHLAKAGYRSTRTSRPVTEMGVRYMVSAAEKARHEDREEVMQVTTASLGEVIKRLVDLPGVDEETKLQLVESLIASRKRK